MCGRSALGLINGTSALWGVAATCCEILKDVLVEHFSSKNVLVYNYIYVPISFFLFSKCKQADKSKQHLLTVMRRSKPSVLGINFGQSYASIAVIDKACLCMRRCGTKADFYL